MLGPIAHIALIVRDPTRTAGFLRDLFDVPVLRRTDAEGHDETFVRLGVTWFVLVGADVNRERTGDHIAFRVARETIASIAGRLKSKGCEFILSESGTSLYFFRLRQSCVRARWLGSGAGTEPIGRVFRRVIACGSTREWQTLPVPPGRFA